MSNKTLSDLIVAAANSGADPQELSNFLTASDLSGYATTTTLNSRLSAAQRTAINALTPASTAADIVAALKAV